ncbi:hypothetical protein BS17DRAFT_771272 [Gyrodon lividus]|nr:hypothetical protein BS17DRAFT_771272 [Gyrodon lividus]
MTSFCHLQFLISAFRFASHLSTLSLGCLPAFPVPVTLLSSLHLGHMGVERLCSNVYEDVSKRLSAHSCIFARHCQTPPWHKHARLQRRPTFTLTLIVHGTPVHGRDNPNKTTKPPAERAMLRAYEDLFRGSIGAFVLSVRHGSVHVGLIEPYSLNNHAELDVTLRYVHIAGLELDEACHLQVSFNFQPR